MNATIQGILTLLFCYLLGSILSGLILCECAYGVDIRKFGSGNVGFTNVKRTLGWKPAIIVLLLDVAKGAMAIWLSRRTFGSAGNWEHTLVLLGGILCIIGNNWSIFFQFAGGKGVATSLGVALGLDWRVALLALLVGILLLLYPGYMSVASLMGTASAQLWFWLLGDPLPYRVFGLGVLVFVIIRHRSNWQRLKNGLEPKFSFKGRVDPPRSQKSASDEKQTNKDENTR